MTTDWSEFVISSFAEALGWNYTPKQTTKQAQSQQIQNQQTNQVENLSSNQITWTCSCCIVNNGNFYGKARAGVVLPDNILFGDGDVEKNREDLLEQCTVNMLLRLPKGMFYTQAVTTTVLFFTRGKEDKGQSIVNDLKRLESI